MAKEDALKWIAEQSAAICNHPTVFPCTAIAKGIGESPYKVRKYMKELEKEGYVEKSHEGGYDDWRDRIYCIHGYSLTPKGAKTEYYQHRFNMEADYWNSVLQKEKPM